MQWRSRVAGLGGQARGKGLHQGGKRTRETRRANSVLAGALRAAHQLQKLINFTYFRWPQVASEFSYNVNLSSKNYNFPL